MAIIVYTKPNCPNCSLTKRDMDILGIEYKTIDISENQASLEELISLGFKSAPVVKTDTTSWSGYNQEKIKSLVSYE